MEINGHSPELSKSITTRVCGDLGRVLNDGQFTDVYAGTLICPRSRCFASQIIFCHH